MRSARTALGAAEFLANRLPRALIAVLLLAAVIINVANVIGRYAFGMPIEWADEVMVYAVVAGVFLGAAPVTWDASHLKMDLFTLMAPRPVARALHWVALVASIGICSFVLWQSLAVTLVLFRIGQRSPVLETPTWILNAVVALGVGLTTLAFIVRAAKHVRIPPPQNESEGGS